MKRTDRLIEGLAADFTPARPIEARVAIAAAVGLVVTLALWLSGFGMRSDLAGAIADPHFIAKPALALLLVASALAGCLALARPVERLGSARVALAAVPIALSALVVAELGRLPAASWRDTWLTGDPIACVVSIVWIAAPMLIALLIALRSGAPRRPAMLGGLAGLAAAGVAGGLFALYCPMDSPLFVASWYGLAALLLAGIGALAGRRWLAW